jgi:hypothetical protein
MRWDGMMLRIFVFLFSDFVVMVSFSRSWLACMAEMGRMGGRKKNSCISMVWEAECA